MMLRLLFALAIIGGSSIAVAQVYPTRPVTVVVPFPAGGPLDFLIRSIQQKMEATLGQSIIVENRPGATGNLGTEYVAKAAPDGYTLLMSATNIGVFPHIFPHLPYDPLTAFAVIGGVAESATVCVVNPDGKFQTFVDLIKEGKVNPGAIHFGSVGAGAPSQLVVELIQRLNSVKFTHVPYKGATLVMNDLLGNFIVFACTSLSSALPLIQQGKLRAIVVAAAKRSPLLPDVPTVKELGLGDINDSLRYIMVAPAKTSKAIMERLSATLAKVLAEPSVNEAYGKMGYEVITRSLAEVSAMIPEQHEFWGPIIKDLNLKLD